MASPLTLFTCLWINVISSICKMLLLLHKSRKLTAEEIQKTKILQLLENVVNFFTEVLKIFTGILICPSIFSSIFRAS